MSAEIWLSLAVLSEAIGLGALRASDGLRHKALAALAFAGIEWSVVLVALALNAGITLAVGYAVWTGAGIGFAAVGGVVIFGDRPTRHQVLGLALVLAGVLTLNLGP